MKSCTRTGSGSPFGRNSRPAFLKSPTSSFFLVSTEIAGSPAASAAFTCCVDVAELRVAVGMVASPRGSCGWPAGCSPSSRSRSATTLCPMRWPSRPQAPSARLRRLLAGPQQRRLRIAARRRLHQGRADRRAASDRRPGQLLASAARPAHPPGAPPRRLRLAAQFRQAATDRAARNAGDPRDRRDPATPSRQRLRRRKPTPPALVQHRIERLKAQLDGRLVNHAPSLRTLLIRAGIPPTENHTTIQLFINRP